MTCLYSSQCRVLHYAPQECFRFPKKGMPFCTLSSRFSKQKRQPVHSRCLHMLSIMFRKWFVQSVFLMISYWRLASLLVSYKKRKEKKKRKKDKVMRDVHKYVQKLHTTPHACLMYCDKIYFSHYSTSYYDNTNILAMNPIWCFPWWNLAFDAMMQLHPNSIIIISLTFWWWCLLWKSHNRCFLFSCLYLNMRDCDMLS